MPEDPRQGRSFDELTRGLADGSVTRRRALKLFVGAVTGVLIPSQALAARKKKKKKVCLCHKPGTPAQKTLCVPESAVRGHLRHGDKLGKCEKPPPSPPPPSPPVY